MRAELPTHYSCADNHRTHELEMTTNKFISDQRILLLPVPYKAITFSLGFSPKILVHNNLLQLWYIIMMTERHSLLYCL